MDGLDTAQFLVTAAVRRWDRRAAAAFAGVLVAACGLAIPFAELQWPAVPGFITAYEAVLVLGDFVTAVLLLGQAYPLRRLSLIVLGSGYLGTSCIVLAHAISFPGLFHPGSLIGGAQTTAWLYAAWHMVFPLFVIGYALLAGTPDDEERRLPDGRMSHVMAGAIGAVVILAGGCVLLVTAGHDHLPLLVSGDGYIPGVTRPVLAIPEALTCSAILILAWRTRLRRVLDLWLTVVLLAWSIEILLSALLVSHRFQLGFYLGRFYGLLAASFVLVVLLSEALLMYGRLARSLALARANAAELVRTQATLAQAQRMEAIGQLTGGVAHDFNNLLTVVTGSLDLILNHSDKPAQIRAWAEAAIRAAGRGQRLTEQLLTFARRQITRPEVVNPNRLLTDLVTLLRRAGGEGIALETDLSPVLAPIRIDPAQFEAAVLNLVINARDAMEGQGRIRIATESVDVTSSTFPDAPEITPGRYVQVCISDTGPGMTPEVVAKAIEPFFTTKPPGRGSGLGLSQVYGFAKSAGGHLVIDSEPGSGTTIRVYLPCSGEAPSLAETASQLGVPLRAALGRETLLVVEDDAEVLAIAVQQLTSLGYRVRTAANAAAALDVLREGSGVDVLFSDVVMPGGMNGVQLAVEARRLQPGIKVLLTSGYTAPALSAEHGVRENLELLPKPYRQDELAQKLRIVIGDRRGASPP